MKYFKHETTMRYDIKVRKLIREFGTDGYAVFMYVIESVVHHIRPEVPDPILEETPEDIAIFFQMEGKYVKKILDECVRLGIFTYKDGVLVWPTAFMYLDKSYTSSPFLRELIETFKKHPLNQDRVDNVQSQTKAVLTEN